MSPESGSGKGMPIRYLILIMLFLSGSGIVSAHSPLDVGSNENISHATLISSPEKSFVLYTELPTGGEAQYYRFPMQKGEILYGSLQVPGPGTMVPDIVIIGPGIESTGGVPSFVEVPDGSGAMVIPGKSPGKPAYEPFSPQPIYEVGRFNVTVPADGDYYIAVYGTSGGKYSLAPGFLEQFTVSEWLMIPWSVVTIHLWAGQSPVFVFAPMILIVTIGLVLMVMYRKEMGLQQDPIRWMVLISGLLYIGGAAMTALQIIHAVRLTGYTSEVIVTFLFIAFPLILGIFAILEGIRSPQPDSSGKSGFKMVIIGLLGLLLWAGLILGPVLAVISGVLLLVKHSRKAVTA
ncbi:MAG: hypothetical protein LUQ54_05545 [Methanoregula sp.]|nr:hypothetical protein [Methanoregula sp.]